MFSKFREFYLEFSVLMNHFQSFSLLFLRLALAYGFYEPALTKWSNFSATVEWFTQLGIPFASLITFLTASFEIVAVLLLSLGLFTRFISIPLMIVMLSAILFVHIGNGFSVGENGFEIPLYYFIFLGILLSRGAGKFSLDFLFFKKEK